MATIKYEGDKFILIAPENATTLPCRIGGSAGETIKAGTPLGGDLLTRNTAFTESTTSPVAVLLHDVTIPVGETAVNGTIIIEGTVDVLKLDSVTAAKITSAVATALAGRIYFVKGAK